MERYAFAEIVGNIILRCLSRFLLDLLLFSQFYSVVLGILKLQFSDDNFFY